MSDLVRILSLSGGGVRGILQAALLDHLETALGAPLRQHFDLVCGTSTGGIVALAVAQGIPPKNIVSLYRHHGARIFTRRAGAWLRRGGRYRQEPLAHALRAEFGNARLGETGIEVLLTASALDTYSGTVLTTAQDPDILLVDAALASAAAPTYFPPAQPTGSDRSFIDGGLWANDPSMVGILHAQQRMGASLADIRVFAVGTGRRLSGSAADEIQDLRAFSVGSARFIFEFLMSAQAAFADSYADSILPAGSYFRADPDLPRRIALDDVDSSLRYLPPLAEAYFQRHRRVIMERFADWRRVPSAERASSPGMRTGQRNSGPQVVYWCGPHNDPTNRDMKTSLKNLGFEVLLPDDLAAGLEPSLTSAERAASIRRICCRAIRDSDAVVVNLATYGLDSAWEIGFAEALGKPIIGYNRTDELMPIARKVNKRFYLDNFMHGWDRAHTSRSLDDLAQICQGKGVYLFCPYANTEAIAAVKASAVNRVASTLIVSNERLGLDANDPRAYSGKARSRAIQFLRQAEVILAVLPRYGMDTAWKMGYAAALDKELIGWITDEFGDESSEADYLDHWMHGWRKKPVVGTIDDLARMIRGHADPV